MNKWILRFFVALMTFLLSVALTGAFRFLFGSATVFEARPYMDFSADQAQIAAIYSEYGAAQTRRDRDFFERVEAENFMLFAGNLRLNRAEDMELMESQPTDVSYEVRIRRIKVFGNSAVARGYMVVTNADGDTSDWPFIDVWVKRNGTWLIQSTTSSD